MPINKKIFLFPNNGVLLLIILFIVSFMFAASYAETEPQETELQLESTTTYETTSAGSTTTASATTPEETTTENVTTTETTSDITEPLYATVIVRYVDESDLDIDKSVTKDLELGEYTFEAKTIPGFNLLSPVHQTVSLVEAGETKELIFEYQALPEATETQVTEPAVTTQPTTIPIEETEETTAETEAVANIIGIKIVFEPYKTIYEVGAVLDLDGLVVHAIYSDDNEQPIEIEDLAISGFDSTEPHSEQKIRVEYENFIADFIVVIEGQEKTGFWEWFFSWPFWLLLVFFLAALIAFLIILHKKQKKYGVRKPDRSTIGERIVPPPAKKMRSRGRKKAIQNNAVTPGKAKNKTAADKKKRRIKILIIIAAIIMALTLLAYVGVLYLLGQMEREDISRDDEDLGIDEDVGDPAITNIAVFGIDSTDGMQGRSDAIMIITLDEKHEKIKITSLIRDSYVDIPGRGLDKINHAHAFGGPELAIKTINQNFKLDIRHYLSVNFTSMPTIIDAVGGVKVKITDAEANQIRGIDSGGTHLLTGAQALQFARIRKIDSDFERSRRQRDIMESTIRAALDTPVVSYPGMLNKVFPYLTTNMSSNQMLNLGRKAVSASIDTIEQLQFPPRSLGKGERIGGIYYFVFDRSEGARRLNDYIYRDIAIQEE